MTDIYKPTAPGTKQTLPCEEGTTPFPEYEEPIVPDDQIHNFEIFPKNSSQKLSATTGVTGVFDEDDDDDDHRAPLLLQERIFPPVETRQDVTNEVRGRQPSPTSPEGIEAALLLLYEGICTERMIDPPPATPLSEPVDRVVPSTSEPVDALSQISSSVPKPPVPLMASLIDSDSHASPSVPPVPSPFDSALRKAHEIYGTPLQPTTSSGTKSPRDREWETLNIMQSIAHRGHSLPTPFLLEALAYRPCDTYDAVHFARDVVLVRAKAIVAIAPSPEAVKWATVIEQVYSNDAVWWKLVWDVKDEVARDRFVECLAEVRESLRWADQAVSVLRGRLLLGQV